jgi:DNA polymerase III sliding clamp (beta) subunit (PCNA family)
VKIEIAKPDLESALAIVGNTVSGSGSDLSAHFLFRVHGGVAQVLAFHHRTFSLAPLKARVEGEDGDAFTVEAWRLTKWVSGVANVAILLSTDGNGEVKVSGGRSTIRLRSLDPSKFPYWDKTLSEAKRTGGVPAHRLGAAVGYARRFVSQEDTTRPEISQIEAMDGCLWSSDRRTVSLVQVDGLQDMSLRVAGKDIPAVLKFLTTKPTADDTVEVLEADSAVYFRRTDGAHVGVARPNAAFPKLKGVESEASEVWVEFSGADLRSAVSVLSASASKDNEAIFLSARNGQLVFSMTSEAGGTDEYPVDLTASQGLNKFPPDGASVGFAHLLGFCDHFSLDTLRLEVHFKGKGGFFAFRKGTSEEDGNSYYTVVVWRT